MAAAYDRQHKLTLSCRLLEPVMSTVCHLVAYAGIGGVTANPVPHGCIWVELESQQPTDALWGISSFSCSP